MRTSKRMARLAIVLVLMVATLGLTTACGGYGAVAGGLIGAGVGTAIGGSIDGGCYDYGYGCGGYYSTSEPGYDDTW